MPRGRVVLYAGGGDGIAQGLSTRASVSVVAGPIESRVDAEQAFSDAAGSKQVDAVVHALLDPDALREAPLAETDEAAWERRCERVLCAALWCAQAAYGVLAAEGGRLVFVTPTIGLTGAAGLVPYATAVEGVRSLAKSAARQWRDEGITVNCVAPSIEQMDGDGDVGSVVELLLTDAARHLTGQTVLVDGGVVML